ncbi:MAG: helicase-associated domain-containing protein [Boseongicola sp.]|nr:helicase-associated domain-containing protein [Boseongicola sp.]
MQPRTLLEALELHYADKLRAIYDELGGRNPARPARKDQLVPAINRILLGRVKAEWNSLTKHERLVVQEAVHHRNGLLDIDKFTAKHGRGPGGGITDSRYEGKNRATKLNLFVHMGDRYDPQIYVPEDLQLALRDFVPAPEEASVPILAELPPTVDLISYRYAYKSGKYALEATSTTAPIEWRNMESTAKSGLLAVLSLIDEGKVSVSASTKRPSAASMKRISGALDGGDFYASTECETDVGPIQAFAWPLLVQAGRLARQEGSRLALTKAGRKALSAPPHETIKLIWNRWIDTKIIDEFSRVEAIKGQTRGKGKNAMRAVESRRDAIDQALAQCPPGGVVSVDGFAKFMVAADLGFEVSRSPWTLYVSDPHYGGLYSVDATAWSVLQDRYLLAFLFEYVATLGLIDAAFVPPAGARSKPWEPTGYFEGAFLTRYDGLKFFRLTALGAYCLELTDAYEPDTPETSTPLSVFPDLRIVVQDGRLDQEERTFLRNCADEEEPDSVWRLSTERLLRAVETGLDIGTVTEFLSARDEQPLPELVEGFLSGIKSRARSIRRAGTGILFECDSAKTVETLLSDKRIAKLGSRTGEKGIYVPTSSEQFFRTAARKMGFGFENR